MVKMRIDLNSKIEKIQQRWKIFPPKKYLARSIADCNEHDTLDKSTSLIWASDKPDNRFIRPVLRFLGADAFCQN